LKKELGVQKSLAELLTEAEANNKDYEKLQAILDEINTVYPTRTEKADQDKIAKLRKELWDLKLAHFAELARIELAKPADRDISLENLEKSKKVLADFKAAFDRQAVLRSNEQKAKAAI
jgi:hypothetical protein